MNNASHWGASVPISMPQPLDPNVSGVVDMDGFCFTANGIAHNLSRADWERVAIPTFAPIDPNRPTERYDAGIDASGKNGGI